MVKKISILLVALVALVSFSSCSKDDDVTRVYMYSIESISSASSDFSSLFAYPTLSTYLSGKGMTVSQDFTLTGESASEVDAEAKAQFSAITATITDAEIDALFSSSKTSFTLGLSVYEDEEYTIISTYSH